MDSVCHGFCSPWILCAMDSVRGVSMIVKRQPEDFRVEELTDVRAGKGGPHAFYRLTKRGLDTLQAVEAIKRRWNLSGRQVSYGGLKDRYAVTSQYLTVFHGPRRGLKQQSI